MASCVKSSSSRLPMSPSSPTGGRAGHTVSTVARPASLGAIRCCAAKRISLYQPRPTSCRSLAMCCALKPQAVGGGEENEESGVGSQDPHGCRGKAARAALLSGDCRDGEGRRAMETVWQDLRFGLRMLSKCPGFTAVAVFALALGIGANATVFTIANAYLFQSLPFVDSGRILYISGINNSTGRGRGESYPDYRDFESQVKSFASLGAFSRSDVDVSDKNGLPIQYKGAQQTFNSFSIIGQKPIVGRGFLPEDARPGAPPVVILSYSLWENRYGRVSSAIGRTIRVNEISTVVIGVMPQIGRASCRERGESVAVG